MPAFAPTDQIAQIPGLNRSIRTRGLSLMTSAAHFASQANRAITLAGAWDMTRRRYTNMLPEPVVAVVVSYANHTVVAGAYEGPGPNTIRIACAVEARGTTDTAQDGFRVPGKFFGQRQFLLGPGDTVFSDPTPIFIKPGEVFWVRSGVSVEVNGHFYPGGSGMLGGTAQFGTNNGECIASAEATTAKLYGPAGGATNMSVSQYANCWAPEAVYCITQSGKVYPGVMVYGDSIGLGIRDTGDVDGSYASIGRGGPWMRALTAMGVPMIQGSLSGEASSGTAGAVNPEKRICRGELGIHCPYVIWAYLRNDLTAAQTAGNTAAQALATCQTTVLDAALRFAGRGYQFAVPTVLGSTNSVDGWTTVAGQTAATGVAEDARLLVNAWLLGTTGTGFVEQAKALLTAVGATVKTCYVIDQAYALMVDNAGNPSRTGQKFAVPTYTAFYDGTATAGTTTTITVSGGGLGANTHRGRNVWIYGGTGLYAIGTIWYHTDTVITLIAALAGGATAAAGSQFRIVDCPTSDALHPARWGNARIASGIQSDLAKFLAAAG